MPGYKVHISFAFILYCLLIFFLIPVPSFLVGVRWGLIVLAGALFPDIDTQSKGRRVYTWILLALISGLIFYSHVYAALFIAILAFIPLLARHRGLLHNFWFIVLLVSVVALCMCLFVPAYKYYVLSDALFFLLGAFSHLVLDRGIIRTLRLR